MEFRNQNKASLRTFRRSLLRYAADLNSKIDGLDIEGFERKTKFFVQTEIVPVLDELRALMNEPARPWYKRAIDAFRVTPELGAEAYALGAEAALIKAFVKYAAQLFKEFEAAKDAQSRLRHSDLYYLLRLHMFQENK